jgi:multiple sugar transport system substrate-binding protein
MDTTGSKGDLTTHLMHRRSVLQLGGLAGAMLPTLGSRAVAKPTTPLHFVGWQYNPQIVAENVATFEKLYDENVDYQLVAGEYQALLETMLIAGKKFDMMYSEEATLARWVAANWARDVEDMADVAAIKESMVPVGVRNLSLPNGKLGGLPYYAGYNAFVFNEAHLDKAKIQPPATWDELLDSARKLKHDKIAEFPYVSHWEHTWAGLSWSLFAVWYSEGAKLDFPHFPARMFGSSDGPEYVL